ncbi:membrane protein insertase YidC [uncultured Limosilactobacillus sp.]|uniref:membrane protein insertase YidC n=1 Tax=uncultured Limosilactobacillus sp. TaxID=2837629 RepID=UPI0025DCEDE9|nr:membrane protein insertase YidC [uncultured Limosilactobacillus sp.]
MKNKRHLSIFGLLLVLPLLLAGCGKQSNGHPHGFIYHYFGLPMMHLMEWFAKMFNGNYGWALVAIVVIVRLILLPLMIDQMKKSTLSQERLSMIQPQMREIQRKMKAAKSQEEQAAISAQMMQLYRDNNISLTGGIGILPLLIQIPVFTGLYDAIRYSPDLAKATFFGVALGKPSMIVAILAFVVYLAQSWLMMMGTPKAQRKQMGFAMMLSPIMILFISISASAGLGFYFLIGGIFAIIQTIFINAYRPRLKERVKKEAAAHPVKKVVTSEPTQPSAHQQNVDQLKNDQPHPDLRSLNAGKQHHHHQK